MIYTNEQLASIEKVKTVFEGYMEKFPDMELIYSEKAGYVLLYGIRLSEGRCTMDPIFIREGKQLCDFLLYELACEVMTRIGNFHDIYEATESERQSIEDAFSKYMVYLPEYKDLIKKQFQNPTP